jgi:hypothetical protein
VSVKLPNELETPRRVTELERTTRIRLRALSNAIKKLSQAAINTSSVQADQFLGGSFTGSTITLSGPVAASQGVFPVGVSSTGARNNPLTNNPIALAVDANGDFGYIPSSQEMKVIAGDYAVDMASWLSMPLKRFTYIGDPSGRVSVGWLAEDLDKAGLREFVVYAKDGTIQSVRVETLVAGLHSAYVQSRTQSQARLAAMEQTVAASASSVTAAQSSVTDLANRVSTDETAATALTGRVTTLEGRQSGYASGTDLTALTTRVTTLEGRQSSYALASDVTALTARVKALEDANKTKLRQRVTSATMGALTVLNSSTTLTITWPTAFADANYTPTIVSITPPGGVLTSVSARITAQTATTCTLLVYTAGIAISAGTSIVVDGVHL